MLRVLVVALSLALASSHLKAQSSAKVWRIGVLMVERPGVLEAIVEGLRELHYIEGKNIVLDVRRAERVDQLPSLAAEIVRRKPDVLIAITGQATWALKRETKTIPIVMASSGDAVAQGIVASLPRPGGNVTGSTVMTPELSAKRLQFLMETVPRAERVGVLGCPTASEALHRAQWAEVQPVARSMRTQLVPIFIQRLEELPAAIANAARQKIDAVLALDCALLTPPKFVTVAVGKLGVPVVYHAERFVQAGGLMSYNANNNELYRGAATFVDSILKGENPAVIPVQQPKKFDLIVNRKAAEAIGLAIPPALEVRVTMWVE